MSNTPAAHITPVQRTPAKKARITPSKDSSRLTSMTKEQELESRMGSLETMMKDIYAYVSGKKSRKVEEESVASKASSIQTNLTDLSHRQDLLASQVDNICSRLDHLFGERENLMG